jgi:3'-5' exoribonuclease
VVVPQKVGIKTLAIGKQFIGFCVVRKKELRRKSNGELYLHLELGDWSGRLTAKIWDEAEKYSNLIDVGKIIKIKAIVQQFQDRRDLRILKLRNIQSNDNVDFKLLLPKSEKDISKLRDRFFEHISSIKNPDLKKLLNNIFSDEGLAEQFLISPAGKLWHHNYLFGMLEHVVSMLDISDVIKNHHFVVDIDLLKSGIILHDVGKIRGYDARGFIEYTDEGRLLGHITLGFDLVKQKIEEMEDFPTELEKQLLHIVLSHQGKFEQGSPVVPQTIEAIVLHYINELDSKANALSRIIEYDILPDSTWSKFIPLLDRFIYHNSRNERNNSSK